MEELSREVTVLNKLGLHARPAAKLAQEANKFQAEIKILYNDVEVDAKSVLDVLTLAVPMGETLTLKAKGEDSNTALKELVSLFEQRFGEDK